MNKSKLVVLSSITFIILSLFFQNCGNINLLKNSSSTPEVVVDPPLISPIASNPPQPSTNPVEVSKKCKGAEFTGTMRFPPDLKIDCSKANSHVDDPLYGGSVGVLGCDFKFATETVDFLGQLTLPIGKGEFVVEYIPGDYLKLPSRADFWTFNVTSHPLADYKTMNRPYVRILEVALSTLPNDFDSQNVFFKRQMLAQNGDQIAWGYRFSNYFYIPVKFNQRLFINVRPAQLGYQAYNTNPVTQEVMNNWWFHPYDDSAFNKENILPKYNCEL